MRDIPVLQDPFGLFDVFLRSSYEQNLSRGLEQIHTNLDGGE